MAAGIKRAAYFQIPGRAYVIAGNSVFTAQKKELFPFKLRRESAHLERE